jgi:hypothetical protein
MSCWRHPDEGNAFGVNGASHMSQFLNDLDACGGPSSSPDTGGVLTVAVHASNTSSVTSTYVEPARGVSWGCGWGRSASLSAHIAVGDVRFLEARARAAGPVSRVLPPWCPSMLTLLHRRAQMEMLDRQLRRLTRSPQVSSGCRCSARRCCRRRTAELTHHQLECGHLVSREFGEPFHLRLTL